jgi:hypothetical protein
MIKTYFVTNYSEKCPNGNPITKRFHGAKDLLLYLDEHRKDKLVIYEAECVVDWS